MRMVPLLTFFFVSAAFPADPGEQVFREGAIVVSIRTSEIPAGFRPAVGAAAQYFRGASTLITGMDIHFKDRRIPIPIDAFFGLSGPTSVDIVPRKASWTLVLRGGDTVATYQAVMQFDDKHLKSVRVYSPPSSTVPYVTKTFSVPEVIN